MPRSAHANAVAAPMPRLPPVMMTMLIQVCLSDVGGCEFGGELHQLVERRQRVRRLGVHRKDDPLHVDPCVSGDGLRLGGADVQDRDGDLAARQARRRAIFCPNPSGDSGLGNQPSPARTILANAFSPLRRRRPADADAERVWAMNRSDRSRRTRRGIRPSPDARSPSSQGCAPSRRLHAWLGRRRGWPSPRRSTPFRPRR